jgi:adenylyltransferase/sulfurtransferase
MPVPPNNDLDRYSRQVLFEPIGAAGQKRLGRSRATLIGCGALGSVIANMLVRGGIGFLRICDRDYLELNNLQRQMLFDESDIARNLPKAVAAAEKLARINSCVQIEPVVADVNHTSVVRLVEGADLILDGTDNFETRYLINDAAVKYQIPWIYGGVIGAEGLVMPILPGDTPCLRCVFEKAPPPEMTPTCDTVGVIAPAISIVASLEVTEGIKVLIGRRDEVAKDLISIDAWGHRLTRLSITGAKSGGDCVCCGQGRFEYLAGRRGSVATTLCGRDAVQIIPRSGDVDNVDFGAVAEKLTSVASGPVAYNEFMLRVAVDTYLITVFADGRTVIKGTASLEQAKSIYARYIGT